MEVFHKHLGERLVSNSFEKVPFSIIINKSIKKITIESNKVIELSALDLGCCAEKAFSLEFSPRNEVESSLYVSKWNPQNRYFYAIIFDEGGFIDNITVFNNLLGQRSEWIYYSKVKIQTVAGDEFEVKFEDQFSSFLDDINLMDEQNAKKMNQIAYNILCRKNAGWTFKAISELKNSLTDEKFNFFHAIIANALKPAVLTPHGYRLSLKQLPSSDLENILNSFIDELESIGYDAFINSGTLLGAVRDGNFIPHDDDVDFGILLKSTSWDDLYNEIFELENVLRIKGLIRGGKIGADSGIFHWKLKYINSISVDLFPSWIIDGKLYVWPYCFGEANDTDLLPFSKERIGRTSFSAPNNPRKLLSINYGDAWGTPDPLFKFDWSNASSRFKDYIFNLRR